MLARILLLTSLLVGCAASTPRVVSSAAPAVLAGFELEKLDGGRVQLGGERAGRPALIALWATWCEACSREFGALDKLTTKANQLGGYVVAVSEGEKRETVTAFVHDSGLRYPQLIDEHMQIGDALGVRSLPAVLVLDRSGRIVYRGGELSKSAIEALSKAIQEK